MSSMSGSGDNRASMRAMGGRLVDHTTTVTSMSDSPGASGIPVISSRPLAKKKNDAYREERPHNGEAGKENHQGAVNSIDEGPTHREGSLYY